MKLAAKLLSLVTGNWLLVAGFFILAASYLLLATISPVHADYCIIGPGANDKEIVNQTNRCLIQEKDFDLNGFGLNASIGLINALNAQISGVNTLQPELAQIYQNHNALASASNLVAGLYARPPASGVQYFAQEIRKFNPIQPAYAQAGTIGYDALKPVQDLWKVFRNASYIGFVIVFVIMGFMIMFRAHISPQAVATVQDSLPRIVIALGLVTFSYAIAGFMIDAMFLLINIVIQLLGDAGVIDKATSSSIIFDKSIIGVITGSWGSIFGTVASALKAIIGNTINLGKIGNFIVGWGVGGIAGLIVGIAALFVMFRIFFMLLMAYITIIILTLAAPFFFLIQALPGNNGAKEWFKQMAANISVFPTIALMIIFAGVITGIKALGGSGTGTLGTQDVAKFPLLAAGLPTDQIGKIIGIGFLMAAPEVATMVKGFMGSKGPGVGMPAVVAGAMGVAGGAAKKGGGALWSEGPGQYFKQRSAIQQETAGIKARKAMYTKPRGGLTQGDIEQYGVGYKNPKV